MKPLSTAKGHETKQMSSNSNYEFSLCKNLRNESSHSQTSGPVTQYT